VNQTSDVDLKSGVPTETGGTAINAEVLSPVTFAYIIYFFTSESWPFIPGYYGLYP